MKMYNTYKMAEAGVGVGWGRGEREGREKFPVCLCLAHSSIVLYRNK